MGVVLRVYALVVRFMWEIINKRGGAREHSPTKNTKNTLLSQPRFKMAAQAVSSAQPPQTYHSISISYLLIATSQHPAGCAPVAFLP